MECLKAEMPVQAITVDTSSLDLMAVWEIDL